MLSMDRLTPRMDHYTCFLPGAIYLGVEAAVDEVERHTWQSIAERITRTCMESYRKTRVGLSGMLSPTRRLLSRYHPSSPVNSGRRRQLCGETTEKKDKLQNLG